ncbi:T9SS type A sorting domain-containing protein [uncultured Algibacter sp.]|uniref:T9SS type A sorting domain-containing protein n=1 Tax=uncultured Algibacter sp. TaxID=298659 RepID=UPI00262BED05|nr:T9SS type A sorting domain-containing protein [uncultured Algibacter sp.]
MKKITLKISAFLLFTMFAFQVQAQANFTGDGIYKISTSGLTPNLYMTVDLSTGAIVWQPEITPDDETQLWTIQGHRTPASAGLMEITGNITGLGPVTMATADDSAHPSQTLIARPGNPVSVAYDDTTDPITYSGDRSGLDQFQRRKAKVNAEGLADPAGANPPGNPNNNALFLQNTLGTNSRYGVIPAAAGDVVTFDGGGIDVIQFHLISLLSTPDFDASSIFVSNPVNDELTIKGLPSNIKQISVYSLLGQEVLSRTVNSESIKVDVNTLTSGMYLVKISSDSGSFTKKIVKQ